MILNANQFPGPLVFFSSFKHNPDISDTAALIVLLDLQVGETPTRSPSTCADQERPKKSAGMFESHPHGHVTYDAKHRNKLPVCDCGSGTSVVLKVHNVY